ncbi:MAG: prohibitin family protein [Oscillospiraceae bacterium]|nr:prohibitin family protein [Oscillospiraceae bacterium]
MKTMNENLGKKNPAGKLVGGVIAFIAAIIIIGSTVSTVPAGHTGVILTMGKVSDRMLSEGMHFKLPFVQQVIKVNNQIQVYEVDAPAVSRDLQTVSSRIAVNYRVNEAMSASIYQKIGEKYESVTLMPAVQESVKAVTAKYTAEELITERTAVGEQMRDLLNSKVGEYGISIEKFNIVNFDFSDEFNKAIEQKQVAEQNLIKTKTEQEQAIVVAKAEAEKKVISAEAAATAIKTQAEAQAEANQLLNDSLTGLVLQNKMLEKWDGQLPKVNGGDSSLLLNVDAAIGSDTGTKQNNTTSGKADTAQKSTE